MLLAFVAFILILAASMLVFGEATKRYWICALGGLLIFLLGIWLMLDATGIQYQTGQVDILYNVTDVMI